MIAALFVEARGVYSGLQNVDVWDKDRDARKYAGNYPIVAHPPCQLWGNLAKVNYSRWGGDHNRPGNDGGCFESALSSLHRCGGVIEHPAFSKAWDKYGLPKPTTKGAWTQSGDYWVCEVWQSAYGHKARKRTWLLYCGEIPHPMRWDRLDGTHQIGGFDQRGKDRNKPTISGKAASATPIEFRNDLLSLAINCRSNRRNL